MTITKEKLKKCGGCKESKPTSEFWKDCWTGDGFAGRCKKCGLEYSRSKARLNTFNESKRRNYERQKKHIEAGKLVRGLVKKGQLVKLSCQVCDEPRSQGHHIDYDYPSKVIWLCDFHHRMSHTLLKKS